MRSPTKHEIYKIRVNIEISYIIISKSAYTHLSLTARNIIQTVYFASRSMQFNSIKIGHCEIETVAY